MTFRLRDNSPNKARNIRGFREIKKKYFFVVEGEKTEHIYMEEVLNRVKEKSLTDIVLLERLESGNSNQYKITEAVEKYFTTINGMSDDQKDSIKKICDKFNEGTINQEQLISSVKAIPSLQINDFENFYNNQLIEQIELLNQLNTYQKGFDKMCLILDRDINSFKSDQYDKVLKICKRNQFLLGISNPNFEFYLLLHITNALDLDKEDIRKNARKSKNKRFCEEALSSKLREENLSYKKNRYDASFFLEHFDNVVSNAELYAKNNNELKDQIGTSVHHILKPLLK